MKIRSVIFCAVLFLTACTVLFAQKTEVSVRKGKVVAETATTSVDIEAGQKAVLKKDANPLVTVDSPLVQDVLELYKLVEEEKQHSNQKIDFAFILVASTDKDGIFGAVYLDFPNMGSEATNVLTLPYIAIIRGLRVYDMNGNLLRIEMKQRDETTASYSIYAKEQVQPGGHFKLIGVANLQDIPLNPGGSPVYYKEGPLSFFRVMYITPNCLNYFRFILPRSAMLVDTNRQIIATDSVDGRVAVTMRNYTGAYADGVCTIALLLPDQDDITLTDIPARYHGLRDQRDRRDAETYQHELTQIRARKRFQDQSTPLSALLSVVSADLHQDSGVSRSLLYKPQSLGLEKRHFEQAAYWADVLTVLSVPQWPQEPGDGYVHPVYMSREGSLIHEFTELFVYQDGKWYSYGRRSYEGIPQDSDNAERIETAKAAAYLTDWEVAGPYTQKDKKGPDLFDIPFGPELPGKGVRWQPIATEKSGSHSAYVNLDRTFYGVDRMVAYLRTQITSDENKQARLEIYSDDGVKAWLNGKLIHGNNVVRGIVEPPDTVNITLKKGNNELMLKVIDDSFGWGAVVRLQPNDEPSAG